MTPAENLRLLGIALFGEFMEIKIKTSITINHLPKDLIIETAGDDVYFSVYRRGKKRFIGTIKGQEMNDLTSLLKTIFNYNN